MGEDEEVLSPIKNPAPILDGGARETTEAARQLFQAKKDDNQIVLRKRKAKGSGSSSSLTPDLNILVIDLSALVPAGLVNERVNQLGKTGGQGGSTASEASPKKLKRPKQQSNALLAATTSGSPLRAQ